VAVRPILEMPTDGSLTIWDARAGTNIGRLETEDGAEHPSRVAYSGNSLITLNGVTGRGVVWNGETLQRQFSFGSSQTPQSSLHSLSANAESVLVAWSSRYVEIFRKADGVSVRRIDFGEGELLGATLDATGDRVLTLTTDSILKLWSVGNGEAADTLHSGEPALNAAIFSSDSSLVAAAGGDGAVYVWRLGEHTSPTVLQRRVPRESGEPPFGVGFSDLEEGARVAFGVVSLAFVPGGPWLASAHENGSLSIWNVETGRQLVYVSIPASHEIKVMVDGSGRWVGVLTGDAVVRLFEMPQGVPNLAELSDRLARVRARVGQRKAPVTSH
jgi:hypothetical protein